MIRRVLVGDGVAIICRNTTEAINHLAYRLRLSDDDVVVTTVVEHHANLLPWTRVARCRYVECESDGTFGPDAVVAALDDAPRPRLLALTGASNVTGWMPALDPIIAVPARARSAGTDRRGAAGAAPTASVRRGLPGLQRT